VFLAEPPRTAYDFHFQLFGFDVRVSPFFWLAGALLGWNWSFAWDQVFSRIPELADSNPGQGMLLVLWIAVVFVSILIHELGHTFAMRHFGMRAHVVLYHFGGLAIPDSMTSYMRVGRGGHPYQQIIISAAGPGVQLALAAVIILLAKGLGYGVQTGLAFLDNAFDLPGGAMMTSAPLLAIVEALLFVNLFWGLMNLLPVYPLDGGQISRELFSLHGGSDGIRHSLILSIFAGGAAAVWGFQTGNIMLAVMFGMLAFSSYQILQAYSGRGGFGPW